MTRDVMVYGLRIRSELALPETGNRAAGEAPDVEIVVTEDLRTNDSRPAGITIAHHELGPGTWYSFVQQPDASYLLRYAGVCDFVVSPTLRHVAVRLVRGADPDYVAVLAGGSLLACLLLLRGEAVLHASAVAFDGRVVAFTGRSGMGKSTLAALACAAGGELVTDDVLRLDVTGGLRCHPGPSELRIRPSASAVVQCFEQGTAQRATADGRLALAPRRTSDDQLSLSAIVIPLPDRASSAPLVKTLDPLEALLHLSSFPRIVGWQDRATQARQFQHLGDLVERVPVHAARMPWGPPFRTEVVESVLDTVLAGRRRSDQSPLAPSR